MAWRNKLLLNLIILTDIFYHFLLRVQKYKNLERLKMIAKFRAHGNRWTAQNRKPIDLSLHDYLFLCKECCYFCLVSSRNLEALQTFDYFYNRLAKFLVIKLAREPYDYPSLAKRQKRTCFLHDLQSFIYVFRISYLFIYVFITWYIHNLVSWVFMLFNDFFSNFLTPGNAARIYCWHRGSNILVETHVIFCFNVTSEFLHQISEFFVFILV